MMMEWIWEAVDIAELGKQCGKFDTRSQNEADLVEFYDFNM